MSTLKWTTLFKGKCQLANIFRRDVSVLSLITCSIGFLNSTTSVWHLKDAKSLLTGHFEVGGSFKRVDDVLLPCFDPSPLYYLTNLVNSYRLNSSLPDSNPLAVNLIAFGKVTRQWLVSGWTNPSEKYACQIGSFPKKKWGESKNYLSPPPR